MKMDKLTAILNDMRIPLGVAWHIFKLLICAVGIIATIAGAGYCAGHQDQTLWRYWMAVMFATLALCVWVGETTLQ